MVGSRRYDEQEIAEILRRATDDEAAAAATDAREGLTLPQIQEIGSEVGIDPSHVEFAARSLEPAAATPPVRFVGAPHSLSRTVTLDRPMADEEWMRLVTLLRKTFGAKGEVETIGSLRTWSHQHLEVRVEPWEDGHRVRMRTFKGKVTNLTLVGSIYMLMAVFTALAMFLGMGIDPRLFISVALGAVGLAAFGAGRLTLPHWADRLTAQMEDIAARIPPLMEGPDRDD